MKIFSRIFQDRENQASFSYPASAVRQPKSCSGSPKGKTPPRPAASPRARSEFTPPSGSCTADKVQAFGPHSERPRHRAVSHKQECALAHTPTHATASGQQANKNNFHIWIRFAKNAKTRGKEKKSCFCLFT